MTPNHPIPSPLNTPSPKEEQTPLHSPNPLPRLLFPAAILLIALLTLLLRSTSLEHRPMHGDEARDAYTTGQLLQTGLYQYNPLEYHGPSLHYLTAARLKLAGKSTFASLTESDLRLTPVLASVALILLLLLFIDAIGPAPALAAALLSALSPAMNFYSRYYIHEMLLVTFTFALITFAWRYLQSPKLIWAILFGLSLGLLHATKETFLIPLTSLAASLLLNSLWKRLFPPNTPPKNTNPSPPIPPSLPSPPPSESPRSIPSPLLRGMSASPMPSSPHPLPNPPSSSSVPHPWLKRFSSLLSSVYRLLPSPLSLSPKSSVLSPLLHLLLSLLTAAFVSTLLFSSFFTHLQGIPDSLLTYLHYFTRAAGSNPSASIHVHPFHYYLQLLLFTHSRPGPIWTESLILLLALFASISILLPPRPSQSNPTPRISPLLLFPLPWERVRVRASQTHSPTTNPSLSRLLVFYTWLSFLAYSLIPYKTPWIILGPLHGMILLAAIGSITLLRLTPTLPLKSLLLILLLAATSHLALQSYRANTRFAADPRNPYVYAHTGTDVFELTNRINQIAKISPQGHNTLIRVITDYCWPLPWYLRQYPNVGYYSPTQIPPNPDAPLLIVSLELTSTLDPALHQKYWTELYGLRPDAHLQAYIQQNLWSLFLQSRTPKKTSNPPPHPL